VEYNLTPLVTAMSLGVAILWLATGAAKPVEMVTEAQYIKCFSGGASIYAGVGWLTRKGSDAAVVIEAGTHNRVVFPHARCELDLVESYLKEVCNE
jgi:hypothetical protein